MHRLGLATGGDVFDLVAMKQCFCLTNHNRTTSDSLILATFSPATIFIVSLRLPRAVKGTFKVPHTSSSSRFTQAMKREGIKASESEAVGVWMIEGEFGRLSKSQKSQCGEPRGMQRLPQVSRCPSCHILQDLCRFFVKSKR